MKCCSRSTLGVIIGAVNILCYIGVGIFMIGYIINNGDNTADNGGTTAVQIHGSKSYLDESIKINRENAVVIKTIIFSTLLSVCLLMVIISGLLIVGIVKRRHKLMWPWLALSGLGFVLNCIRIVFSVIFGSINGLGLPHVLSILIGGVLGLGIHGLILWPIYTLCRDIAEKNKQKPGQHVGGVDYRYVTPDAPPQYSYNNLSLPQKS